LFHSVSRKNYFFFATAFFAVFLAATFLVAVFLVAAFFEKAPSTLPASKLDKYKNRISGGNY